ncbi:EF-hand domain-containing protein [Singulisphaera rosea]
MIRIMGLLGIGALATGLFAAPARSDDAQKDIPGPIDSLQDLQDTGKMVFKLADENNDGQVSQKEATDAGNLLVGGVFFRADANGDGVLSKEELTQARDSVLAQKPILKFVVQKAKAANPAQANAATANVAQGAMSLLDSNNDGQIQANELRQLVQTSVQGVYAAADTNRDGQMSPMEVNAAVTGLIRSVAQATFRAADADGNGQLSQAEYDKAIVGPANAVFNVLDANGDGQISEQEAQSAQRIVANQIQMLQVPEPANSPRNLIRSGKSPEEVAPIPTITAPVRPAQPAR